MFAFRNQKKKKGILQFLYLFAISFVVDVNSMVLNSIDFCCAFIDGLCGTIKTMPLAPNPLE